jgi:hypothetical protein
MQSSCKWRVFKVKANADGYNSRFEARLVAQSFSQQPCVDYMEAFSLIVKLNTLRAVMSVACKRDTHI